MGSGGWGGEVGVIGRLGWSGVGRVRVGVVGNGVGFVGVQVRGLGRSKELGVWGRRSLGREIDLKQRRLVGLGSGSWSQGFDLEVEAGGVGVGIREVGGVREVGVGVRG